MCYTDNNDSFLQSMNMVHARDRRARAIMRRARDFVVARYNFGNKLALMSDKHGAARLRGGAR